MKKRIWIVVGVIIALSAVLLALKYSSANTHISSVQAVSEQPTGKVPVQPATTITPITIYDLWTQINAQRTNASLSPLALDARLNQSASAKCGDIVTKNYWAHDSPDGLTPWYFINNTIGTHNFEGENLLYGSSKKTADSVVTEWMRSQEHRENILKPNYTNVGYGICHSDSFQGITDATIIVQHFIGS